jgi:predicted ATP-dependent endonuclease of OLD family
MTDIVIRQLASDRMITIPSRPLMIFVGANGSGKTTMLKAIHDGRSPKSVRHVRQGRNETLSTLRSDLASLTSALAIASKILERSPIDLTSTPLGEWSDGHIEILSTAATISRVLFHASSRVGPWLLVLDDLGPHLHPDVQQRLMTYITGRVKAMDGNLVVIGVTHSPYMLDVLSYDEVYVTCRHDDGTTACKPLTHHPQFLKWKDEFKPGEMWSFFGEEWVTEEAKKNGSE